MKKNNDILDNQNVGGKADLNDQEQLQSDINTNGENSYGKFENLGQLLKAYNCLQAEFTKRSQQLKQLEGENRKLKNEQQIVLDKVDCNNDNCSGNSPLLNDETGISKDVDNTLNDANCDNKGCDGVAYYDEVDSFLNKYPEAKIYCNLIADKTEKFNDISEGFLEKAYIAVLNDLLSSERAKITDQYIYDLATQNPCIKDSIIKDYLNEVLRAKSNVKMLGSCGESALIPPKKPKNFNEAGQMAVNVLIKK